MILYIFKRFYYNKAADQKVFPKECDGMEYITLPGGIRMPQLGYGTLQIPDADCERCVGEALKTG